MSHFLWDYVYIVKSEPTCKYYCGQTDNIELRLLRHNNKQVKSTIICNAMEDDWICYM